jgi:hypothetical protein
VTCKESDQDLVYIILYKFSDDWIPRFFIQKNTGKIRMRSIFVGRSSYKDPQKNYLKFVGSLWNFLQILEH